MYGVESLRLLHFLRPRAQRSKRYRQGEDAGHNELSGRQNQCLPAVPCSWQIDIKPGISLFDLPVETSTHLTHIKNSIFEARRRERSVCVGGHSVCFACPKIEIVEH